MNSTPQESEVPPALPPSGNNTGGTSADTNGSRDQQKAPRTTEVHADNVKEPAAESLHRPAGHVALATCELCREHGGYDHKFRVRSVLPKSGDEDPELFLGRTKLYELMDTLQVQYSCVGGKRVMYGASKCRYYRENMNKPVANRGGDRRSKEAEHASTF